MSFTITACSALTPKQCAEIEALQKRVYEAEGLQNTAWLSNEINFDRTIPCFFLGHENDVLVSFLTLFLPGRAEGEVVAFTARECRDKGYFTALLEKARKVLKENGVPDFLFALEPQGRQGMAYLYHHFPGAVLSHTEWRMFREPDCAPMPVGTSAEPVTKENLLEYLEICQPEYGDQEAAVLRSEQRASYLVRCCGKPVGVFSMVNGDVWTLCGVVVAQAERGKGYGRAVVRAALNLACEAGKRVELDVDSENPPALRLYKSFGFKPTFEVQYWRAPV